MPVIKMKESRVGTYQLQAIGSRNTATLATAADVPLRVVVRNIGSVSMVIAHTSNALAKVGAATDVYLLPPDRDATFVLAPGQGLFAAGIGLNGRACIAVSEAIPLFQES